MLNKKRTNKEETNNKKSVKSVKINQTVSQDTNNNLQVTINRNSNTGKRRVLKTGSKKSNKLSVTFSNRKPIEPLYEDSQLSQIIDYYNEHLRQHNSIKTPKFSSRTKYKKNYNLFHDGIHPNRTLSKLWMYRIIKLASELEYK